MELEWDPRPLLTHNPRDWHDHPPNGAASSSTAPPSSFIATSPISQRRRSSAAHIPPAAPPPDQPIPSIPTQPPLRQVEDHFDHRDFDVEIDALKSPPRRFASGTYANGYGRPATSGRLEAVAAFSQARLATASNPRPATSTGVADNLMDSPPRSMLPSKGSSREIVPDRLLLSPHDVRPSESRPSSRRALTKALELAREAVQLDSKNDDPYAAVAAYGRSVALLSEVMERVRRGEDSTESSSRRRNGRRRSVVAQEEEVRRLKAIHDTYADRMNILSVIYSIPPMPLSPSSIFTARTSMSTDSAHNSSSSSPTSDSFTPPRLSESRDDPSDDNYQLSVSLEDAVVHVNGDITSEESTIVAAGTVLRSGPSSSPIPPPSSYHPYAAPAHSATDTLQSASPVVNPTPRSRSGSLAGRVRSSSVIPPPFPPPTVSPPPAPVHVEPSLEAPVSQVLSHSYLSVLTRPRGNSTSHKRTGSGSKLAALDEELEKRAEEHPTQGEQGQQAHHNHQDARKTAPLDQVRRTDRESHPLPPLPSSTSSTPAYSRPGTPRNVVEKDQDSPVSALFMPRQREGSNASARLDLDAYSAQNLINPTTNMGTISQRRSKSSAPAGASPPPPETMPNAPARSAGVSLQPAAMGSIGVGRNRASSQPGRRPSVAGGRMSPLDRPPVPQTAGIVPRKLSGSSKFSVGAPPPQLIIQTDLIPVSALSGVPPNALIPPPPVPTSNVPITPSSPLPPMAPSDSLRKPYHMMNLIRITMTAKTGGYLTRRLHVPQEVWSQGGAKLANVLEKVRVVEVLCSALEDVQTASAECFGAGNVGSGMGLGIGSIGKKEGEAWIGKLDDFSAVCDGVVANFGKKLGVGEGFALKKTSGVTSWGGKLTRQLDKFTNGKNLDSPAAYVTGLSRLFTHAQLLDEHTKALLSHPVAPSYAAFSPDIRGAVEVRLKRSSEFFATVVLTFVIRDLSQLLDKYAKKCEKWLAE